MNNKQYNFIIGSIYVLYFAFIIHYWQDIPYAQFISYFSEFGFYFCCLIIGAGWIKKLPVTFLHPLSTPPTANSIAKNTTKKDGLLIMTCLLISHLITLFHPFLHFTTYLSFLSKMHENAFIFSIGFLVWLAGLWLIKKGGDKKILITVCMILFIHGFYHLLFWSSLQQQMKSFVDTYTVAVQDNIIIKECKESILCVKMDNNQIKILAEHSTDNMPNGKPKILVQNFMNGLEKKINNSNKDEEIVTLTYGDNIFNFINKGYPVIAVYDKKTQLLYLDYHSGELIAENHEKIYAKLTGFATAVWISLLILMIFWHNVFVIFRRKQVRQNENKNEIKT